MKALWWRLTDVVSHALDAGEREAVLGDLAESSRGGARALVDVLDLAARRHAALWLDWRPWVALLAVVVPLGMLLSLLCRWWSEGAAIDAFVYLHNGRWTYLSYEGWRHDVARETAQVGLDCLALACWSWMAGFVIGSLSRPTAWVNGGLLAIVALVEFAAVDQPHGWGNSAVFSAPFYDVVLPFVLRVTLVVLPALLGTRTGRRRIALPLSRATALALAVVVLTGAEMRGIQTSTIVGWWHLDGYIYGAGFVQPGWQVRMLPLLLLWPALYIVATSSSRQSPRRVP